MTITLPLRTVTHSPFTDPDHLRRGGQPTRVPPTETGGTTKLRRSGPSHREDPFEDLAGPRQGSGHLHKTTVDGSPKTEKDGDGTRR